MPTELEELVEFLHHGNTQIRQIACENLVGYSSDASIFKKDQLIPVKDLKLLVRDYPPIAKNATTILINLTSHDTSILAACATDDEFLRTLINRLVSQKDPNADLLCQLLANLCKDDSLSRLLTFNVPPSEFSKSSSAFDQLLDLFTLTTSNSFDYAYLSYTFASLSGTHEAIRTHLLTIQTYDGLVPLSKLLPFTEHDSTIRRAGVASTIKNCSFVVDKQQILLDPDQLNILPYILLPLAGPEPLESDNLDIELLPDLQLLPPDKKRESDPEIILTHLETLLLLTTTREGRDKLREAGTYLVVRALHEHINDESVREGCERLVNMLMRDEAEDDGTGKGEIGSESKSKIEDAKDNESDERQIEEIF